MVAITTEHHDAALIQHYMPKILAAHKDGATLDNPRPIVCLFDVAAGIQRIGMRRWCHTYPVEIEQGRRELMGDRLVGFGAMSELQMTDAFPDAPHLLKKFTHRGDQEIFVVLLLPTGVVGCIIREVG